MKIHIAPKNPNIKVTKKTSNYKIGRFIFCLFPIMWSTLMFNELNIVTPFFVKIIVAFFVGIIAHAGYDYFNNYDLSVAITSTQRTRLMNSVCAFVHPGECEKIEITSEESDKVFKHEPSEGGINAKLFRIFSEIGKECKRQDEKWGEQNHSMVNQFITPEICRSKADFFKKVNKDKKYFRSWFTILLEEVYEAFAETDPARQREEMIQVAAVAVQIIKCLDRCKE